MRVPCFSFFQFYILVVGEPRGVEEGGGCQTPGCKRFLHTWRGLGLHDAHKVQVYIRLMFNVCVFPIQARLVLQYRSLCVLFWILPLLCSWQDDFQHVEL